MEALKDKVLFELGMIKLREVQIEDMKLRIEDMRIGDTLKAIGYDDMPVSPSKKCANNDSNMFAIEKLEAIIKRYEISNKRIHNALNILNEEEIEVVQLVCIDKVSFNKASVKLGKQRQTLKKIRDLALGKMVIFYTE